MDIKDMVYAKIAIVNRYGKIERDSGVDLDGNGKIQDGERLIDSNKNGKYDNEEYMAFLKTNEGHIRKDIPIINSIYSCKYIYPNNIIHDCLTLESELFSLEQSQTAYQNLDELIGKIKNEINNESSAKSSIQEKLFIAFKVLIREGYVIEENSDTEIEMYLNNIKTRANAGKTMQNSREKDREILGITFTGNMLIKYINCNSSSLIMLALAEEMSKEDMRWSRIGVVWLPGHVFLRYDIDANIDQGLILPDRFYIEKYMLPGSNVLKPLDRSKIASLFYKNRGVARIMLDEYSVAIKDLDIAIKLNPASDDTYCNRGYARLNSADMKGARADFDKAIELNPKYAKAYFNRGVLNDEIGDSRAAIADYDRAIGLNFKKVEEAYFMRAAAKIKTGDYQGAIKDCDKAIRLNQKDVESHYNRAIAKSKLGDYQGAIADYDKAIGLYPRYDDAYCNRGNSKFRLKDYKGAISDFSMAIELNPKNEDAYYNRGTVKAALYMNQEAIRDFDRLIQLNPAYGKAYFNRGAIEVELGQYEKALSDFKEAKRLGIQQAEDIIMQIETVLRQR